MRVWRQVIVLVGFLAAAGIAAGAALDGVDDGSYGRARVVTVDDDGDRHERTWVFEGEDRGWLGVMLQSAPDGGARILDVMDDSPALDAGLEHGDVITAVDGEEIRSPGDLHRAMRGRRPGDQVELEVIRDGDLRNLTLELGESPRPFVFSFDGDGDHPFGYFEFEADGDHPFPSFEFDSEALEEQMAELHEHLGDLHLNLQVPELDFHFRGHARPRLGIQVIETTPELREHLGGSRDAGVLVGKVLEDSPAEEAGIQVGDLILVVAGAEVSEAGDISRVLRRSAGETVELEVIRDGQSMTMDAFIPEPPEPEQPRSFAPSQPLRHRIDPAPTSQRT